MTHYDFDAHIDKLTAIIARRDAKIAERDEKIAELESHINMLFTERDSFRHMANQRWRLREELEELVGLHDGETSDPEKCEAAIRMIAGWKATIATLRVTVADLQADVGLQRLEIADLLNDVAAATHRRNLAVRELQRINKGGK